MFCFCECVLSSYGNCKVWNPRGCCGKNPQKSGMSDKLLFADVRMGVGGVKQKEVEPNGPTSLQSYKISLIPDVEFRL